MSTVRKLGAIGAVVLVLALPGFTNLRGIDDGADNERSSENDLDSVEGEWRIENYCATTKGIRRNPTVHANQQRHLRGWDILGTRRRTGRAIPQRQRRPQFPTRGPTAGKSPDDHSPSR